MKSQACVRCNSKFEIDENDQGFYQKMGVPLPSICPECRFKRRALWRNETILYSGENCDLCKKNIVTMYNPKSSYKVYCNECYRGDKWDAKDYAMDYDFSKTFFEQLDSLLKSVPKCNLYTTLSNGPIINSEYNNMFGGAKNCYFLFNGGPAEETMYSRGVRDCKEISDAYFGVQIEQCYEVVNVQHSSKVDYGQNSTGCSECHFILNCSGLLNCFGCVNLRNKSYCWFNEQLTKEDYDSRLKKFIGSFSEREKVIKEFYNFSLQFPRRENNNLKTNNCLGECIFESKNTQYSFEVSKAEDCKYLFSSKNIKDSYDVTGYGFQSEQLLDCVATGWSHFIIGSYGIDQSQNIQYSFSCYPSNNNLIGCDSMRNSQYCILNKQYTKEEYEKIKAYIVKELTELGVHGLMMPSELAPFAYNETIGQDNFPMTKEEVLASGFRWEEDIQMTKGRETLIPQNIPDHIRDVTDDITSEILKCILCERNYKIIPQEFAFYRKMILPIPRKCFYCRHKDRIIRRGPYKFWDRNCDKCQKGIVTNYEPERPEIVYCEQCYQQEVI